MALPRQNRGLQSEIGRLVTKLTSGISVSSRRSRPSQVARRRNLLGMSNLTAPTRSSLSVRDWVVIPYGHVPGVLGVLCRLSRRMRRHHT